jgi:hypothetical protein
MTNKPGQEIVAVERVSDEASKRIYVVRAQQVMLDHDLADFYGVSTSRLMEQVRRNPGRFPEDFMFQLTPQETLSLRSQNAISKGRGGRRYQPYAFTEHGALALSGVLKSPRAAEVSVIITRAYVVMRERLGALTKAIPVEFQKTIDEMKEQVARLEDNDVKREEFNKRLVDMLSGFVPMLEAIADGLPNKGLTNQRQLERGEGQS